MNILKQFEGKINGTLEAFDRIIINGYLQQLHSYRLFLYYLIQKNVLLKDFQFFAAQQTAALCQHIESYIQQQGCPLTYLNSGQTDKGGLHAVPMNRHRIKRGLSALDIYKKVLSIHKNANIHSWYLCLPRQLTKPEIERWNAFKKEHNACSFTIEIIYGNQ